MRLATALRRLGLLFTLVTVLYALSTRQSHGELLKVPFEFRLPTLRRVRDRWWNKDDSRLLTPHVFGVGWSLTLYRLANMLGDAGYDHRDEKSEITLDEGN